jgi:Type VI secretion system (T6SS), amidase effector protein 4
MGAKKPGPICATTAAPTDQGTLCRHRSSAPGPAGVHPLAADNKPPKITFSALWDAYPGSKPYRDAKSGKVPEAYENQCAIKVSVALHGVGVAMKSFHGASVELGGKKTAVRATELADWLKQQAIQGINPFAEKITGENWQSQINGRSGIVYFSNYWARPGEAASPTGDHIDLWNGHRLTASGFEGTVVTLLRFGLGVSSGPGFSDLGKAELILFWEVK